MSNESFIIGRNSIPISYIDDRKVNKVQLSSTSTINNNAVCGWTIFRFHLLIEYTCLYPGSEKGRGKLHERLGNHDYRCVHLYDIVNTFTCIRVIVRTSKTQSSRVSNLDSWLDEYEGKKKPNNRN